MTQAFAQPEMPAAEVRWRSVPKQFVDPPAAWNPTVGLFLGGYALAALTIWGWFAAGWPLPVMLITGFLALHLEGTVVHDACHKSAHPVPWVNQLMGHGSALLLGFSFPVFTRVHLEHHAHVNDPKNDPDHIVSTFGPLWLIAPRFFYHEVFFFQRKLWKRWELMQWGLERAVFFTIIAAAVTFDFLPFIFNCWFAPALMVGVTLGLFFDYLPHRPFTSRNRWTNARIYPGRLMNWLIMGQNYHLVHHLWPSVPWFEYKPAYEATKPLLDAKGSPQRLGIFETRADGANFLYDILVGVRSHKHRKGKMRRAARFIPGRALQRSWLGFVDRSAIKTQPRRPHSP